MPSQYPKATNAYDPTQVNQLVRTLINDLTRLEQPVASGYSAGDTSASRTLSGAGQTYATGYVGTVTVVTNGSTSVTVNSGTSSDLNNVAQVLAALIDDMKARGLLG
jgi:hypothetical protein